MNIRWLLTALGLVAAMTAIAWLPTRSAGREDAAVARAGGPEAGSAELTSGCPANAKVANLDFTLKDMYGRDVKLSAFKGKVLLINFWATWCAPCREETPGFVALQQKYKKQGLEVVGVSIDDEMQQLPPFAREFKVNYPLLVGRDHEDMIDAYGPFPGIPVTVLVGRDGRMCYNRLGLADLDQVEQQIKSLL